MDWLPQVCPLCTTMTIAGLGEVLSKFAPGGHSLTTPAITPIVEVEVADAVPTNNAPSLAMTKRRLEAATRPSRDNAWRVVIWAS